MTQQRHNPGDFTPPHRGADIIPFRANNGEALDPPGPNPVLVHLKRWGAIEQTDVLSETIVADTDPTDHSGSEEQERLKEALRDTLHHDDYYEDIRAVDPILRGLESRVSDSSGEGMTTERKALLALMDVRILDVMKGPDGDLAAQLAKLPLGDEEQWIELMKRL